ncbi:MAG: DMT family transporter [Bacteroidales bacterium]|nr:DMT family transporter [Bacteroidales bacterium]
MRQFVGHLASFGAYAIFGLNIIFCKDIANQGALSPILLFTLRALCAGALFWILSLFTKREHVPAADLLRMAGAGMLGLVIPQMTFLTAITMTAPIDLSVVQSTTPIMTMFVAAIFLKEPISWQKAGGVALSFLGVMWLILQSTHTGGVAQTRPLGIILTITNAFSFALYLGICRPVIQRYSVVTLMKWMFLFSFVASLPFSAGDLMRLDVQAVPSQVWLEVGYLILFATFVAYFLIPVGQQRIRPTLVSMYGYLQPIIATVVGVAVGMDRLTVMKVVAAICVFAGVAIVNRSPKRAPVEA